MVVGRGSLGQHQFHPITCWDSEPMELQERIQLWGCSAPAWKQQTQPYEPSEKFCGRSMGGNMPLIRAWSCAHPALFPLSQG